MKLHFLKTVWSDLIVLEERGRFALVDTGMADQFPMLRDYLDKLGAKALDFILLTHFHRDHYGSIPDLIKTYPVGTVYFKEYSGLDANTAWGSEADDAYRADELEKYRAMQALIREKSTLVQAEGLSEIAFAGHPIRLYNTENSMRAIYEDPSCPETYRRYVFGENQNSLAAVLTAYGVNVFLGGDVMDAPAPHPLADYVNRRIAREIGRPMDVYKAPHHGTVRTATPEALAIYRPRVAIITNGEEFLTQHSDCIDNLKNANPDVRIFLTERETVVVTIGEDGSVSV